MHRHRELQRLQVDMVVLGGVVQHRVEVQFLDLADRAQVPRQGARHFRELLALQHEQVADLERPPSVADEQLAVARDHSLVYAQDAHLADVRVLRDLEHVGQHMQCRIRLRVHRPGLGALAPQELRRIGFARVREQPGDHLQQFGDAGTGARGHEAYRDQMAFAQRLFQRRMQLRRVDVAVVQVAFHKASVDFHHLLHQRAVRPRHRREIGRRGFVLLAVEAVDHPRAAAGRQVHRQALAAESGLDLFQQRLWIHALRVDLVDDDQPVAPALCGPVHHPARHRLDARGRADDDGSGLHRFQRRQRLAQEFRRAGRVDQVRVDAAMPEMQQRRIERMKDALLKRIVVADGGAALHAAGSADRARFPQQCFGQRGFARSGWTDQGQRAQGCDVRQGHDGLRWKQMSMVSPAPPQRQRTNGHNKPAGQRRKPAWHLSYSRSVPAR